MYSWMYDSMAKILQSSPFANNVSGDQKSKQSSAPKFRGRNSNHASATGDHRRSPLSRDKYVLAKNGYSVGRKIDSGTFATVRYAEKRTSHGRVALAVKIIDMSQASPLAHKFLLRELDIWPRLRHRNIVRVDGHVQIQGRIYIFMELAHRGSVIDYLQQCGAVDERLGRRWCRRLCQALRYCHSRGVAHRDVKCDNLLLTADLDLKVGDFGFCCLGIDPRTGSPAFSDTFCGSSSYAAPEVIESRQPYDPVAADVWSAGICMYVILNNAMPFDDSHPGRMHRDQVARNWFFVNADLSDNAKHVISRMLEPDPTRRPSMDQVLRYSFLR